MTHFYFYPQNLINSCVKNFLDKQLSAPSVPSYGPNKKPVLVVLPFIGPLSSKLCKQLKRSVFAVSPTVELRIVFVPVCKLASLSNLKSSIPTCMKSDVIYKVNCQHCDEFYVGMTTRRLSQRLAEHAVSSNSALHQHSTVCGHQINFSNPVILACDNNKKRLLIKETLNIAELGATKSLNKNVSSYPCKLW